jgi:hypothetical protein
MKKVTKKMTIEDLAVTIDNLAISTGKGFADLEDRLGVRINGLEATMRHEFSEVGSRLTGVEKRLGKVEDRLDKMEYRLDKVEDILDPKLVRI